MARSQGLELKQSQSQILAITPELQQSLKILQLSTLDLTDYLQRELDDNPLLSVDDEEGYDEARQETSSSDKDLVELSKDREFADAPGFEPEHDGAWHSVKSRAGFDSGEDGGFENRIVKQQSLREHLLEQLYIDVPEGSVRAIGTRLVDLLDDSGYFTRDPKEVAEELGCKTEEINSTIEIMQKLDPAGIFARNLSECLRIQLEEKNRLDPAMLTLVSNLEILGRHKYDILQEICGVSEEELTAMIEEVRALNPKPASGFDLEPIVTVQPDVFVRRNRAGVWSVEMNIEALPKILVNNDYYREVSRGAKNRDDKKFLSQRLHQANWLVRALEQRTDTIMRTAAAIVKHQEDFFNYGIKYLKPMTLARIAEELDIHESTASRVTTGKYMATPRGLYEMKYFFSSGLRNVYGTAEVSSETAKFYINDLISKEDPKKPFSDDELAKLLKTKGISISRRTVTKYREAVKIPSSVERRKV